MGSLRQRGRIWRAKYHRNGRPFEESSHGGSKDDAKTLLTNWLAAETIAFFGADGTVLETLSGRVEPGGRLPTPGGTGRS
jgi:hypothetical protein